MTVIQLLQKMQQLPRMEKPISIDYDSKFEITYEFYKTVQNKMHLAIHGQTAAEVILNRANAEKKNMGLSYWKNSPDGPIRKADVSIAKNYLSQKELIALNQVVGMYLDYAERQAQKKNPMKMLDWAKKLDSFLEFNGENILTHAGKISHQMAQEHAEKEFEKYELARREIDGTEFVSDFDKMVKHLPAIKTKNRKNSI